MKSRLPSSLFVSAVSAGIAFATAARAEQTTNTIKFSDPAKPGTVKISLGRGELHVQGTADKDVVVTSDAKAVTEKRKDGMRVLSASSSFSYKEAENTIVLDAASGEWGRGNSDFRLKVPSNTTIIVQNGWGGDISCAGISGDIEINNMHGEIRLDNVSGGVVVGTLHGEIRATVSELHEGKPLSFTSMSGEVVLRLPETAKANVRLRTQNGSVLTDFDESVLVTKTESTAGFPRGKNIVSTRGTKVLAVEIQDAIREAAQVSATAVKEALEAVKDGFEAARLNADEARRQVAEARTQIDQARREADLARRESEQERRLARTNRNSNVSDPAPPAPPFAPMPAMAGMPPKVAIPTISGGKLVTGTLNGGGPEISVATMNGDVVLRKLGAGK